MALKQSIYSSITSTWHEVKTKFDNGGKIANTV